MLSACTLRCILKEAEGFQARHEFRYSLNIGLQKVDDADTKD